MRPGLHVPERGDAPGRLVGPAVLDLDRKEEVGLRQEKILVADDAGRVAEEGIAAHAAWQRERAATLAAGATPSLDVRSATALSQAEAAEGAAPPAPAREVEVDSVEVDRAGRPGGRRFGTLVHAVLAAMPLDGDLDAILSVARAQGRLVAAPADEVRAAADAAAAARRHPLFERAVRAARAGGLRRETPVLHHRPDGILVEGVVDLAFRETADGGSGDAPRWTVVDFKTDRELETARAGYEAQVRLYVEAIEAATGEPARGVLLRV